MAECKNCENYKNDCGYHIIDEYGHVNYDKTDKKFTNEWNICLHYVEKRTPYEIAIDKLERITGECYGEYEKEHLESIKEYVEELEEYKKKYLDLCK